MPEFINFNSEDIETRIAARFIAQLVRLRHKESLSQSELADAIGLSEAEIDNIEQGVTYPDLKTIAKFARFYHKEFRLI